MARVLLLSLLGVLAASTASSKTFEGSRVYRLLPANDAQLKWLQGLHNDPQLDFWTDNDVMVSPERQTSFLEELKHRDISSEMIIADVQKTIDVESMHQLAAPRDLLGRAISFDKYYRYDEIREYLDDLASNFSDIVTVASIGNSSEGRELLFISISTGGDGDRPVVLVDAGIYGREWIAPAMALYIINQLVENSSNADLIAKVDWHIIPVLNPDGYEYTHTSDRFWRKTRSISNCSMFNPRHGVDANRNFDFHWMEIGARSEPCAEDYAGPHSFSEPETAALRDHVNAHPNIKLYVSLQSPRRAMMYPWAYTQELPDDWHALDELARNAIAAQAAVGEEVYYIGSLARTVSYSAGASLDWVKGVGGVNPSYTIELPGGGNLGYEVPVCEIASTVSSLWAVVRFFGEHVATLGVQPPVTPVT